MGDYGWGVTGRTFVGNTPLFGVGDRACSVYAASHGQLEDIYIKEVVQIQPNYAVTVTSNAADTTVFDVTTNPSNLLFYYNYIDTNNEIWMDCELVTLYRANQMITAMQVAPNTILSDLLIAQRTLTNPDQLTPYQLNEQLLIQIWGVAGLINTILQETSLNQNTPILLIFTQIKDELAQAVKDNANFPSFVILADVINSAVLLLQQVLQ